MEDSELAIFYPRSSIFYHPCILRARSCSCERGETGMSIYTIVKFLHVSGAIGYFIAIGTWLFGLAALRRVQRVEQVRVLSNLVGRLGPLFGISVLLILATGLYMALTAWGLQTGWIAVALTS